MYEERKRRDDASESCLCPTLAPSIRSVPLSMPAALTRVALARYVFCLLTYTIFVLTLPPLGRCTANVAVFAMLPLLAGVGDRLHSRLLMRDELE